jgi:DNA ligase-1
MTDKVAKMKAVYDILMKLRATQGTNAKRELLEANSTNAELKLFLYHVYEPTISYYQTKIMPATMSAMMDLTEYELTYDLLDEIIENLAERIKTGHDAMFYLGEIYAGMKEQWMRDMLTILIERDIKAGIKYKNVNKVWPKLITAVPYMRCTLPKNVDLNKWPWEQGIDSEIKYDGMYANIHIYQTEHCDYITSRKGSVFMNAPFVMITEELRKVTETLRQKYPQFANEKYFVFNGELEMLDKNGALMPRAEGNGKFNSMLSSGEIPHGYTAQYKVWDFQPGSKFEAGQFDMQRRSRKVALSVSFVHESRYAILGQTEVVYSYEGAVKAFKRARALGLEGTIVKHPEGIWKDGTSDHQVKMKAEVEIDLELVSFNVGSGRNEDTFGSIRYKSSCGQLEVDVNGRTDDMREWFNANRDNLPGTIHTVVSNELTKPKKKGEKYSLFLPRYIEARLDKTEANSLKEVLDIFANAMKDEDDKED